MNLLEQLLVIIGNYCSSPAEQAGYILRHTVCAEWDNNYQLFSPKVILPTFLTDQREVIITNLIPIIIFDDVTIDINGLLDQLLVIITSRWSVRKVGNYCPYMHRRCN